MLKISKDILNDPLALFEQFEVIEDPRIDRHKRYPLINILVFAFVAILSDQQSWYQIFGFAKTNLDWFSRFIDTSSGVPSGPVHFFGQNFGRTFSPLSPSCPLDSGTSRYCRLHSTQLAMGSLLSG